MRRSTTIALTLAMLALPAAVGAAPVERPGLTREAAPSEVIVRFEAGTSAAERRAARGVADVAFERSLRLPQAQVVEADGSVEEAVRRLERQPDVAYAQPNHRYRALAPPAPNDPQLSSLWGLSDPNEPDRGVNALPAWNVALGDGQVIAVVDTGVDLTHPDLVANLWSNPGETVNGVDDGDLNDEVDDVRGYDFVDDDGVPDDFNFHGTHVAGTAAAAAGNSVGVAGVAPNAEIMAVRVLDGDGSGFTDTIADGIHYAAETGADVINLSLGGPAAEDEAMEDAIAFAATRDAVVVAAAGNSNSDNDDPDEASVPCALPNPNLICVAATDRDGAKSSFSSYGSTTVDLGAPGRGIVSAEADYDTLFADGFEEEPGLDNWATPFGSSPWGPSTVSSVGAGSAADSPFGSYAPDEDAQLVKAAALNFVAERGCRMHFRVRYDIEEGFDELLAGAVATGGQQDVADPISGSTSGAFKAMEVSISDLDGLASVAPAFALFSDESVEADGAYVDAVEVMCRGDNANPAGSYTSFNGTSMATPHVAGVVALVRSAAPAATAGQAIAAVLAGTRPLPALADTTVTGGLVDACLAVDEAIAAELDCGGFQPPQIPGGGSPDPDVSPPVVPPVVVVPDPPPVALRAADLDRSPLRIRVGSDRRFSYPFRALAGLSGDFVLKTGTKVFTSAVRLRRKAQLDIARKQFAVPASGRVKLGLRLSRRQLRILRLNGGLSLRVRVVVRASDGRSATATKRLRLLVPKRR